MQFKLEEDRAPLQATNWKPLLAVRDLSFSLRMVPRQSQFYYGDRDRSSIVEEQNAVL